MSVKNIEMYHKNPINIFYPWVQVFFIIIEISHVVSSSEIHLTRLNSDSNLVDGTIAENGSFGLHDENSTSTRSAASMYIYDSVVFY